MKMEHCINSARPFGRSKEFHVTWLHFFLHISKSKRENTGKNHLCLSLKASSESWLLQRLVQLMENKQNNKDFPGKQT